MKLFLHFIAAIVAEVLIFIIEVCFAVVIQIHEWNGKFLNKDL